MRPFLEHERDKVLLVPPEKKEPREGDVALVLDDRDRYVLHRVLSIDEGGNCTLCGDGNSFATREHCTRQNVIGVAQGFYIGRKERYRDVEGRAWRWYSWWWMHTTWMRRLQLLICKIFFKLSKLLK